MKRAAATIQEPIAAKKLPTLIDEKDMMKMFGVSRTLLRKLRNDRRKPIPCYRMGRLIKYDLDEAVAWWNEYKKDNAVGGQTENEPKKAAIRAIGKATR